MEIILPNFGLFFWTLVVFLTLFFLLKKFAWKPILKAIKDRETSIEEKLNAAQAAEAKMQQLTADNEKLLQEARAEREVILREANNAKDRIVAEAREQAKREADKLVAGAQQQIALAQSAAAEELRKLSANLALEIAEKVLRQEFADKARQQQYVDSLLKDVTLN
ncbi:MAG: F0F1 ATP synthase subunit B [Bacteroidetes bacterium]|nr:F0F1 ATP synthase subunit B [Bacteroidota bacterium]